ncbi:MAG TPA: type 1 glutamine amidotransferase domain-containing protein [Candidatus Sulfotelmatobacter sp.]|jgi:putative intracellular protease/amidase|nr:type 1 glutamine amidotransferase domain-containing protein [Candidatus Sulfotelmatobacter sp.]
MTGTLKILIILTSHAVMGNTGHPTGVWFEELATPYYAFIDAGADVDIASIDGGKVPVDPASQSASAQPASVARFLKDPAAMRKVEHSLKIDSLKADGYAAVFLPGGHGTMWDLPGSTALADLLSSAWDGGKVVAAVCHGPAGLVNVKDAQGRSIVAGRRVSAFTNAEEMAAGFDKVVPFMLETRIRELGATYVSGPDFQPFAVRDGKLVTGQNPASSEDTARLTLQAVRE